MEKTDTLYDKLKLNAKSTAKVFTEGVAAGLDLGGAFYKWKKEDSSVCTYIRDKLEANNTDKDELANAGPAPVCGAVTGMLLGFCANLLTYFTPAIVLGGAGAANHYIKNRQKGDKNLEKTVAC